MNKAQHRLIDLLLQRDRLFDLADNVEQGWEVFKDVVALAIRENDVSLESLVESPDLKAWLGDA